MITAIGVTLLFFGSFSIFGIFAIIVSTIITNIPWWRKSYRKYQRRFNNIPAADTGKMLHDTKVGLYAMKIIEMLSITAGLSDNDQSTNCKNTELGENQSSAVPLRFQPERLYGSTTYQHDNQIKSSAMKHRKSICSHLMPNIDSTTVMARRPSGSLFPHPKVASLEASPVDTNLITSSKDKPESPLVRSSVDLNQPDVSIKVDFLELGINFNVNSLHSTETKEKEQKIPTNKLPERRASHASIYAITSNQPNITPVKSETKTSTKKMEKVSRLVPKSKSRRSSLSCMVSPFQNSRNSELQSGLSNLSSMIDFQTSFLVDKEITRQKKVPPPPIRNIFDLPAGSLALSIDKEENLLKIRIARAVHLPVHAPWAQNGEFFLKVKLVHKGNTLSEQIMSPTKNALGCLEFGQHFSPTIFDFPLAENLTGDELLNIYVHFEFYEGGMHSSTEFLIASLVDTVHNLISSHQTSSWNKGGVKQILWHNLKPGHYAEVLTGDALVSLCRIDREGSVWLSIPELRNLKFPNSRINIDKLANKNINVKLKLRVCIINNSKIIRSKKGFKMIFPLSAFIPLNKVSSQKTGVCNSKLEIKFNESLSKNFAVNQEQMSNMVHFSIPTVDQKIGSEMNYQIVVFLSTSFDYVDYETRENKKFKAIGRIIIANQGIVMNNCVAESSQQLWKEAVLHNGNRVYQWLSIE